MRFERKLYLLLLLCTITLTLSPTHTAEAFWKGVGEWSGPGPWWGIDVVYPINLDLTPVDAAFLENDANVRLIDRYFVSLTTDATLRDQDEITRLFDDYGAEGAARWQTDVDEASLREGFVNAMKGANNTSDLNPDDPDAFESWATAINVDQITRAQERTLNRFRFPGLSKLPGLFTSQRNFRLEHTDTDRGGETVDLAKELITVSFGYSQSYDNDLPYGDFTGSRTVQWLTLYPAYERRFCPCGSSSNFFWNFGPAVHYFYGDAFESFREVSARTRIGWSYHWKHIGVGVGFEGEYFGSIEHRKFGALDDGTHEWGWGVLVHIELPGFSL